jgi:hypothetical protein
MKLIVERFKVGRFVLAVRRVDFASASLSTWVKAVCQSAAAIALQPVALGIANGFGSWASARISSTGPVRAHTVVHAGVDRHDGQFG